MHPFVLGNEYDRDQLLRFVGSRQQQTGVIWGKHQPGCTIITSGGRHGRKAGYVDEQNIDGSWKYFGQGQSGNHSSNNVANRRLIDGTGSVLLFLTREPTSAEIRLKGNRRKSFKFQGAFNVCGYEIVVPESGARQGDTLLCFRLLPVADESYFFAELEDTDSTDITSLRSWLLSQSPKFDIGISIAAYRQRSGQIRKYAILRSQGRCEACGAPPPFVDDNGQGFLEVHHITRLADDGLDAPENVAAICPNCHRRAHYSVDRLDFRNYLLAAAKTAEDKVTSS
jgi:5-methylcytosine-specific restriction protein A